jgi:hypothetical protein
MTEIFQEAIKGYNLPLTILVGMIGLYWVISLFGFIDFESIDHAVGLDDVGGHDFDAGVEVDAGDVHVDADGHDFDAGDHSTDVDGADHDHAHTHHDHSPNAFQATLRFLGASDAPIMFVLTLFALYTWGGNMLANFYFNDAGTNAQANILLLGVVVGALILTKITVRPLRPVMKMMRSASSPGSKPLTGRQGTVRSKEITVDYGQIEIYVDGASILLNARLSDGCAPQPRGAEVLVVSKDEDRDLYIVRPLSLVDTGNTTTDQTIN